MKTKLLVISIGSIVFGSCKPAFVTKNMSEAKAISDDLSDFDVATAKGSPSPLIETQSRRVTLQSLIQFFYCTDQGKATRSVEQFTELLPNYIFDSQALIFNKSSLCGNQVDPQKPRVVLYDKVTGFVIAYTNDPKGTCYQSIEFMQVTAKQKVTSQEKKPFHYAPQGPYSFFAMNLNKNEAPTVHGPNLTDCAGCHQNGNKPLLPIWHVNPRRAGNNTWPNVFFGVDQTTFEPKPDQVSSIQNNPRLERISSLRAEARPVDAKFVDALTDLDDLFRDDGAIDPEPAGFVDPALPGKSAGQKNVVKRPTKALDLNMPIAVDCGGVIPNSSPNKGACIIEACKYCRIADTEADCKGFIKPKNCDFNPDIKFVAGGSCSSP